MHTRKKLALALALLMALGALAGGVAAAQAPAEAGPAGIGPEAALVTVGTGFTYQGRLTDAGNPAAGPYDFVFRLYDALTGGSQVGGIVAQGDAAVSNGLFTVSLDFGVVFDGAARWLEIAVRPGASNDAYAILSPRQALAATPYALHSLSTAAHDHFGETWTGTAVADGLRVENTAASGYAYGLTGQSASTSGRGVYGYASAASGTTYGVQGQSASTGGYGVHGVVTAASGDNDGVFGEAASTSGRGVRGLATASIGVTTGVMGTATSNSGRGVYGMASASTGPTYGMYGESASTSGRGVYGRATAASGQAYGVHGVSASSNGRGLFGHATSASGSTYGVVGETESTTGAGVQGYASTATGINYGVWGMSLSTAGTGVLGQASAATGATFGVYGQSSSDQGYGVYGVTWASTGVTYGVYGRSLSTSGYAGYFTGKGPDAVYIENTGTGRGIQVDAEADTAIWGTTQAGIAGVDGRAAGSTGRGVYGYATATTGVNAGVYGRTNSPSGYAGYFQGNLHTTGTLSKAAGSFKIDHPLDPANRYLYHSFVESPDMMNIYNGNVTLDEKGEAWVELPAWFEALNRDFRYQLTPIGGWAPLFVAQKVQENRFEIAGGEPGMEVSWQVTGIRQDAYANAHRLPVEEPKPAEEKGFYLHPTELGQPSEQGLDYRRSADSEQPPEMAGNDPNQAEPADR